MVHSPGLIRLLEDKHNMMRHQIINCSLIFLTLLVMAPRIYSQDPAKKLSVQAEQLEKSSRYQEAIQIYINLLNIDPHPERIYNNLGIIYLELGENAEAIAALNKSIYLDPKFEKAYYNLGTIYYRLGRSAESIQFLKGRSNSNRAILRHVQSFATCISPQIRIR
jgi:tetratricopeptide (TPR) repeat protein